ncbi:type I-E CRISPR-associated protein Cas7/Cse4/CasC [uncultured Sphaerochaeta sp.]|jgi:CRISPR system Cascade subunit CasC|uniref:type I-E CRISPR-associated protein Cas7/Cse4/CasC n=1 Tax=uncultured Sphaerochaeta sp. TaxID=886478 RepID=UPI002631F483|nr:type I-E CRISPR-associated protein Cas7/Cse4/CasC [uncultured Sphaerochaeta sp.]
MKKFLQIHVLTSYPPANLNRDDLGRPKTAIVGGTTRLRVSSQSLKRAWRTSDIFEQKIGGTNGIRTKRFGETIFKALVEGGIKEEPALQWARSIAGSFGAIKSDKEKFPNNLQIEQLAFISPEEQKAALDLVKELIDKQQAPTESQLRLLRANNSAADMALFGRMLAKDPSYNIEASVQVAHAFSVQKIVVEDDFFTAVDDLNEGIEDQGAGHMGDTEFASGVFYTYINIDRELLLDNLRGCAEQAPSVWKNSIEGLVECIAKVAPTGKQNSFGSRAYAHYILAELGDQQPRTLSLAFIKDVGGDIVQESIQKLESMKDKMDNTYGPCSDESFKLDVISGKGSFSELIQFCVKE